MQNGTIPERELPPVLSRSSIDQASPNPRAGGLIRVSRTLRLPQTETWLAFLGPLVAGALLGALAVLVFQAVLHDRFSGPSGAATGTPAATAEGTNLQVTISAGLLASLIQDAAARGRIPLQLENVRVQTGTDQLTVNGDAPVLGGKASGSAVFQPYVADGRLAMHVVRAQFGGLPIPNDIALLAEQPINDRIAAATSGLPAAITDVKVDAEGITISAHVSTERRTSVGAADGRTNVAIDAER
jgi:hypothetical protein